MHTESLYLVTYMTYLWLQFMSDTLQMFCVSKPILLTSISVLWRTWSPAHTKQGHYFRIINTQNERGPNKINNPITGNVSSSVLTCVCVHMRTWATEMNVLVLVVSTASKTPRVIGQSKKVLESGRVSYGPVQTLHPLLALLERCKVASVENPVWSLERLGRLMRQ